MTNFRSIHFYKKRGHFIHISLLSFLSLENQKPFLATALYRFWCLFSQGCQASPLSRWFSLISSSPITRGFLFHCAPRVWDFSTLVLHDQPERERPGLNSFSSSGPTIPSPFLHGVATPADTQGWFWRFFLVQSVTKYLGFPSTVDPVFIASFLFLPSSSGPVFLLLSYWESLPGAPCQAWLTSGHLFLHASFILYQRNQLLAKIKRRQ